MAVIENQASGNMKTKKSPFQALSGMAGRSIKILGLIAFIFFSFKSCIVRPWSPDAQIKTYAINGQDGRTMFMVFMPKHETMIWYANLKEPRVEGALVHMLGEYGTHYFGPIWRVEGQGVLFGWRWYSGAVVPICMEIETKAKFMEGQGDSTFPRVGSTSRSVILEGKDRINFQGMWLQLIPTDEEFVNQLYKRLQSASANS